MIRIVRIKNNNENNRAGLLLEKARFIVSKKFNNNEIEINESSDNFISALIDGHDFNLFYSMLSDSLSRKLFDKTIIYRYLLRFYPKSYTNNIEKVKLSSVHGIINIYSWCFKRLLFQFTKRKYPSEVEDFLLFYIFHLNQYNIKNIFEVSANSIVFDIGAWRGDTAFYFSKKMNNSGKIYAFEPDSNAFETLNNVCEKYDLQNVETYNILFSDKKCEIPFIPMGFSEAESIKMNAITVDEFVEINNIKKIDFIKMDVEGAEINILKGLEKTIKKLRPSLAVAIYHGGDFFMEDFYKVPVYIKSITENYNYYIRTFSPWGGETILFCIPNN